MTPLAGKNIFITGATGGIGGAVAETLAQQGARIAVTSRDIAKARSLCDTLAVHTGHPPHLALAMDITSESSVADAMQQATAALGAINILVNVPGLSVPGKIADMSVENYDQMMSVNTRGLFLVAKHYVKSVDPARGGLLIAIGSVAGKTANPNAPVYCAAKAALAMLMSGLAMQVKQNNIKVTTLIPGAVSTKGFWGDRPVPHDKFMLPSDVANAVSFVCSLPNRVVMHEMIFEPWEFFKSK